jgi:hypothetical protein
MNYFPIKETTIFINPFEQITVNGIRWIIASMPRSAEITLANCTLIYVDEDGNIFDNLYFYNLPIPKNVLDVWLNDEVIDNYIIENSQGLFELP